MSRTVPIRPLLHIGLAMGLLLTVAGTASAATTGEFAVVIEPAKAASVEVAGVSETAPVNGVVRMMIEVIVSDGRCILPTACNPQGSSRVSPGWRLSAAVASRSNAVAVTIPSGLVTLVGIANLCRASDAPCSRPWDGGQAIDPVHGPRPTIAGVSQIAKKQSLVAADPGFGNGVYLLTLIIDVTVSASSTPAQLVFSIDRF